MPSITKTKTGSWKVQYYQWGKKHSKTLPTKAEAKKFVALLELGQAESPTSVKFRDLITSYRDTVSVKKAGYRSEIIRLNALLKRPIANLAICDLTPQAFQKYIEERMTSPTKNGQPITGTSIRREFTTIRSILGRAVKQGYIKNNPAVGLEMPPESEHRERIASGEDLEKLKAASGWNGTSVPENITQLVILAFFFACRTGVRSGELIKLERSWISGNVIHMPKEATKTRTSRNVALGTTAKNLLDLADQYVKNVAQIKNLANLPVQIFYPLTDARRDALFRKVRDRAGLGAVRDSQGRIVKEGLNFHDSRATFATWAASPDPKTGAPRLDVLTLARQTGHKDLKMLQRYYRASSEEIAQRLAKAEANE